jgi:hypothetical protein
MVYIILIRDNVKKVLGLALVFEKRIWHHYRFLIDIILDYDQQFTFEFLSELCKYLVISQYICISFQPEINKQFERLNLTIKIYV